MYLLSADKQRVELQPLETAVVRDDVTRAVNVRAAVSRESDPVNAAGLIARACRMHFDIGRTAGGRAAAPKEPEGPPPVAFREVATGLLHVVYREVVLRFAHGVKQKARRAVLDKYGFKVREKNPFVEDQVVVYQPERRYSGERLLEISNEMAETDEVIFATPNFVSQFRRHAPPSIRAEEWHLLNRGGGGAVAGEDVDISAAWQVTTGRPEIVVAVLDDGVDVDHPNLRPNIWRNPDPQSPNRFGRDFFVRDDDPGHFNPRPKLFRAPFDDTRGNDIHGTPCAGVIAAPGRNGGSVGAAPRCRVLPVKVFHADDFARGDRVADAIRFAATIADILSCSWSGAFNPDIQLALADAGQLGRRGKGAAVFCAAGNEFGSPVGFPASDPNAIAVGASTDQARLASYSNVGPEIAFVAPSDGGTRGIFTTDVSVNTDGERRGYNLGTAAAGGADGLHTNDFGGTSSATPLAAGVAALVLSVNPDLTRTDLRDLLASTTDRIGNQGPGHSHQFGSGRINAGRAVQQALGMARNAAAARRAAAKGGAAKKSAAKKGAAKKGATKKGAAKKSAGKASKRGGRR